MLEAQSWNDRVRGQAAFLSLSGQTSSPKNMPNLQYGSSNDITNLQGALNVEGDRSRQTNRSLFDQHYHRCLREGEGDIDSARKQTLWGKNFAVHMKKRSGKNR